MDCFVEILTGLLKIRNINLTEISNGIPYDAQLESCYRRIQRFIHGHWLNYDNLAWFVLTACQTAL